MLKDWGDDTIDEEKATCELSNGGGGSDETEGMQAANTEAAKRRAATECY